MATRSQRYTRMVSSHPYHSSISSAPSFALDATDGGDHGAGAVATNPRPQDDDGLGALASPRLTEQALRGALLVETYSSDPRAEFLESMAEMAAGCDAEGMTAPEYREFMEELLACYLERNARDVHRHVLAAFADLTARRRRTKRMRSLRGLMKINPCVSGA
ncbi:hypothetical protein EJB05_31148, partial [Eragrostis curvula]